MATDSPWRATESVPCAPPNSRELALAVIGETPHLVWTTEKVLYHAAYQADGWTKATRVGMGEQPALVASPDNRLHCLFANEFVGNYEIYHVVWDGKQWSLPENVSHTSGASARPAVAAGPAGSLHAVWSDTTPGYPVIYYGRREEKFWSAAPIPSARGTYPTIAVTPKGTVHVAWQDRLSSTQRFDIFCCAFEDGAWGLPLSVSDTPAHHSIYPQAITNPVASALSQGGCHLIWQEERGGVYRIQHADLRPGGWAKPVEVSDPDTDCRTARLGSNRQGFPQAVWLEGQELRYRVRPPEYDAAWWTPENIDQDCRGLSDLAMAISRSGRIHVAWSGVEATGERRLFYTQRQPLFRQTNFLPLG